jgi:hypothetical protein
MRKIPLVKSLFYLPTAVTIKTQYFTTKRIKIMTYYS